MRCYDCRYMERSIVLASYPPQYRCNYDGTPHYADHECEYEHHPIIRCKDCKHHFYDKQNDCYMCYRHEYGEVFNDDDFCSWAERREP